MSIRYIDLGKQIKKVRIEKGLTQEKLAERVGIGTTHVSHIETAKTIPSLKVIINIMNELKVSPNELFCQYADQVKVTLNKETAELLEDCSVEELRRLNRVIQFAKQMMRE